jgi:polyisoprenoid-binding protein YceI
LNPQLGFAGYGENLMTTDIPGYVAGKWSVDAVHSDVAYTVTYLGIARSHGSFTAVGGTVVTEPDILGSSVSVEIDAASVASGFGPRDAHLRSPEFFDAEAHPVIAFRSTGVRVRDGGHVVDGELTWRGRTVPVALDAVFNGVGRSPAGGGTTALAVSASTTVDRRDFGVGPEGSGFLSERVEIAIELFATLEG